MEKSLKNDIPISREKPIVLAIDDVPEILRMVHLILKDKYKVYTLAEPEKMEELLKELKPDIFLLDYCMPELDGFDLMPIIRSFPEHANTPVVYLTSVKSADFYNVAMRLGASDYIMKPVDADKLRETIGRHFTD